MAENRFPYTIRINTVGRGIVESIIISDETHKELGRFMGDVCRIEPLAHNVHLLTVTGNELQDGDKADDFFVILFGEKLYLYSKHMKYLLSYKEKKVKIVDKGVPSTINYGS